MPFKEVSRSRGLIVGIVPVPDALRSELLTGEAPLKSDSGAAAWAGDFAAGWLSWPSAGSVKSTTDANAAIMGILDLDFSISLGS